VTLYLADTSAWHRSGQVEERWSAFVEQDELALCTPVRLELLFSARGKSDYRVLASDLSHFPRLPIDMRAETLAVRTQAILAERSQYRGPRPVDLLIAAVAEVHDVVLLHYDHHFDQIVRVTGQPAEWLSRPGSLD
jgi:predicted nucleic acid-binding protein